MRSFLALLLLALLAPSATLLARAAVNVAEGETCGNLDTCATGLSCYDNKCATSQEGLDNGLGNTCSATDCCVSLQTNGEASRLVCNEATSRCAPSVDLVPEIACTPADPDPTPDPNPTGPFTDLKEGDDCGNLDMCEEGLSCYTNKCAPTQESLDNGLGNTCSATDCCVSPQTNGDASRLVCNEATNRCTPSIDLVPEIACTATPGPGPDPIPDGQTGLEAGATCGNRDTCAEGLACYNNECATSQEGLDNGLGNSCSATDCCTSLQTNGEASRLVCNQATMKCAPSLPDVAEETCTAVIPDPDPNEGEPTVVQVTNPDGSVTITTTYPDGTVTTETVYPDAAAGVSASMALIALLATAAGML